MVGYGLRHATIAEAVANGASGADISQDLKYGFLKLHDPYFAARGEPGVAASDTGPTFL